jgi:hypothetical protein
VQFRRKSAEERAAQREAKEQSKRERRPWKRAFLLGRMFAERAGRSDVETFWKRPRDAFGGIVEAAFAGNAAEEAVVRLRRRFLPRDCEYQPCDLHGGPDVLVCDFNADRYPAVTHRYDVLVVSGLLEFLRDPEAFLAKLPALGDTLLFSYRVRPPKAALRERLASGYMSHLTTADLETMLDRLGYRWDSVGVWKYQSGLHSHLQLIYRVALGSPRRRGDARRTGRATSRNRRRRSAAA